jgi:alkylation response protein AidB-like acyl-CoA dehydrogenase
MSLPMDLEQTGDQELLRETTARFIEDHTPLTKVRELIAGDAGVESDYLRDGAELGWFAMLVPEEFGGGSVSGNGVLDAAIIAEERGRFVQPGPFVPMNVVAFALATVGGEDQRAKVLPTLVNGEAIATWAVADSAGDWRPDRGVIATRRGADFLLSGSKGLVQDAHLADWILVTASGGPDTIEGGVEGTLQFLVPASTPGVSVRRLDGLDLTRRLSEVHFEGVEVPASALVGSAAGADEVIERQFQLALVLTVAESIGAMDRIFEVTVDYAKARTAFGRPIGSFQAIKHLLADTSLLLETSKAAAIAAARSVQLGGVEGAEAASIAKAYVGDCGVSLAQNCFQVFGGIGFTWEHDQHLYLRRLTTDAMLYGQPAWHRERICTIHGL